MKEKICGVFRTNFQIYVFSAVGGTIVSVAGCFLRLFQNNSNAFYDLMMSLGAGAIVSALLAFLIERANNEREIEKSKSIKPGRIRRRASSSRRIKRFMIRKAQISFRLTALASLISSTLILIILALTKKNKHSMIALVLR